MNITVISTGCGILAEFTKGTRLTGTGSEHHWLYNFHCVANAYTGLLQSRSSYMQGNGATQTTPALWTADKAVGDPDFSRCENNNQKCRFVLATTVDGRLDILLYNSVAWTFFNSKWDGNYGAQYNGCCQSSMMRVTGELENLVRYSISTRKVDVTADYKRVAAKTPLFYKQI